MLVLWPLIIVEGGYRFFRRAPGVSRGRAARQWLMVALAPPLRMGLPSRVRPDLVWLPLAGWRPRDEDLPLFLERFFSPKILVLAGLTLPLLAVDYVYESAARENRVVAWLLHLGHAAVWLAFAVEFILRCSAARSRWRYARDNWIDLAIVLLPFLDLLPALRLWALGGLLSGDQLARTTRLYRLRGLLTKAWRALLLLNLIRLLWPPSPRQELEALEAELAAKERELERLRRQVEELRQKAAPNHPV
jgi:hypothetical protein